MTWNHYVINHIKLCMITQQVWSYRSFFIIINNSGDIVVFEYFILYLVFYSNYWLVPSSFENFNSRKENIYISFVSHFPNRYDYQFIAIKKISETVLLYSSSTHRLPDLRSRLKIFLRISYLPRLTAYPTHRALCSYCSFSLANRFTGGSHRRGPWKREKMDPVFRCCTP